MRLVLPLNLSSKLLVPAPSETWLLRACLCGGEAARSAFERWSQQPAQALEQLQADGGAKRRLIPLLHASVEDAKATIPAEMLTLFRAASLYEQLRTQAYHAIAKDVLTELNRSGAFFLATRGVCFGASLYGGRQLRHCHDVDLLVPAAQIGAVAEVLRSSCGFRSATGEEVGEGDLLLYHSSGLPLALHVSAFAFPALSFSWDAFYASRVMLRAYDAAFETPSPEMSLLHVILHGSLGLQRRSLVWICDAYKLIASGTVDWTVFVETMQGSLDVLIVVLILDYLTKELEAAIPLVAREDVLGRWNAFNASDKKRAQELLLLAVLRSGSLQEMLGRVKSPWQRGLVMQHLVFPAPGTLMAMREIAAFREAPSWWAGKILRGLRRAVQKGDGISERSADGSTRDGNLR